MNELVFVVRSIGSPNWQLLPHLSQDPVISMNSIKVFVMSEAGGVVDGEHFLVWTKYVLAPGTVFRLKEISNNHLIMHLPNSDASRRKVCQNKVVG